MRRGKRYDRILLAPPSFGRGKSGELYKIEHAMLETLENVKKILSDNFAFVYLTSHTPGLTPIVLSNSLNKMEKNGEISSGEMLLTDTELDSYKSSKVLDVPNGTWACLENI